MESSKHDCYAFWHSYIPPLNFFLKILFVVPSFQFMNFSEAMLYENYLTSDFQTNCYFKPVCLLVKMASKTVIGPIEMQGYLEEQS